MDWARQNKTLASILGVMVAGGIALAVLLFMAYSGYAATLENYQRAGSSLGTLKGAKLYPSAENVEAKQKAIDEYEAKVSTLGTVLLKLQKPVEKINEVDFQAKLRARSTEIKAAAEAAKIALAGGASFAFGFDTYLGVLPRNGEVATELGDYLGGVDSVVSMMIESGVKSIDTIARTELAIEKGAAPPPPVPEKKKAKAKTTGKKKDAPEKKSAPPKEIAKVVERRTLTVTLTADQNALQNVMNKLASSSQMPYFTVVRLLRVDNTKLEGPLRSAVNVSIPDPNAPADASAPPSDLNSPPPAPATPAPSAPGVTGTPGAAPVPTREIIEPAKPAAPDAMYVFGDESLKVYLEIDLVRFLEPASEDKAAEAAK